MQRMQPDAAAETEFQSLLAGDAARRERSAAGAGDRTALAAASREKAQQELTPQEAVVVLRISERGAARPEPQARLQLAQAF